MADVEFFWDPMCPFAWQTSRWLRVVAEQRTFSVDWRFISLRILNEAKDYERDFPPGYVDGHSRGLELLRVAAAVREAHGGEAVGRLYEAYGGQLFMRSDGRRAPLRARYDAASVEEVLRGLDLPADLAAAIADEGRDAVIREETELALSRTGKDVGTPIVTWQPPDGLSFFGPVISVLPDAAQAVELWDAMLVMAKVRGFAELKRSLRDPLDLPAFSTR